MADTSNECDHVYCSSEVERAEWIQGNAQCIRVTRWMLHCAQCGDVKFVNDPDQPQLLPDKSTD